jgi:DNA-binding transcriptional LysR family regulator
MKRVATPDDASFPTRHQLRLIAAVAEHPTLTAAANALRMSQPALTAQVKAAEDVLGVRLFSRGSDGVRVTQAGELVVAFARREAALQREIGAQIAALRDAHSGSFKLGASTAVGEFYIPDALSAFRARYPSIGIEIFVANSAETLERLRARDLDVAIMALPSETRHLEVARLFTDRIVPFAVPGTKRRIAPDELATMTVLTREEGSDVRDQGLDALARIGATPLHLFGLSTNVAVIRMVQAGFGELGVLSESSVTKSFDDGELVPVQLRGWRAARTLGLVRPKDGHNPLAERFWTFMLDWVGSSR